MIRKIFFWAHLSCGLLAGLVIFMMSLTGVLLTYERQILNWSAQGHDLSEARTSTPLPLEQLLTISHSRHPDFHPTSLIISKQPGAPVILRAGREGSLSLDPYNGQEQAAASPGLEEFFSTVTAIHRWFNVRDANRSTARAITGASNLMFLFLILSGLYLWLPRIWKWMSFKLRLFFVRNAASSKIRDFNWHHVIGIWSALPLAVIVATAAVFSYGWANDLVYQAFGEQAPVRRSAGNAAASNIAAKPGTDAGKVMPHYLSLDQLVARAANYRGDWRQLTANLPKPDAATLQFTIDQGNGGQPQLRHSLSLDRQTGEVRSWQPFSSQSPGRQARTFIRFLHTGEALGFWGQTLAGLVSFASLFMVWTGFALAWRRLLQPLLRNTK
ncbi:MAG: PepSY-associated TM helix domain-containing protein [Pseudomonadales bacterium]|nr:PepSY-associated TM helix domain-containing protein [Pseudomonadales bacterium]